MAGRNGQLFRPTDDELVYDELSPPNNRHEHDIHLCSEGKSKSICSIFLNTFKFERRFFSLSVPDWWQTENLSMQKSFSSITTSSILSSIFSFSTKRRWTVGWRVTASVASPLILHWKACRSGSVCSSSQLRIQYQRLIMVSDSERLLALLLKQIYRLLWDGNLRAFEALWNGKSVSRSASQHYAGELSNPHHL